MKLFNMKFFTLVILLFAAWTVNAAPANDAAKTPTPQTVLIIGDALSTTHYLPVKQRWVNSLQQRLKLASKEHKIINLSNSQLSSIKAAQRLDWQLRKYQPTMVVLEVGSLDRHKGYTTNFIKKNLQDMVKTAKRHNVKVVLVGLDLPPARIGYKGLTSTYEAIAKEQNIELVGLDMSDYNGVPVLNPKDLRMIYTEAQPAVVAGVWNAIKDNIDGGELNSVGMVDLGAN